MNDIHISVVEEDNRMHSVYVSFGGEMESLACWSSEI
jgi:hypothetical protein